MRSSVNLFSNVENQMCIIALKIEKPQPSKVPMGAQGLPARFPYVVLLNLPAFQPGNLSWASWLKRPTSTIQAFHYL